MMKKVDKSVSVLCLVSNWFGKKFGVEEKVDINETEAFRLP